MARDRKKAQEVKMDMTPMIDVVFQLIIFFILTMTVTSPDLRPVQLPTALTAVPEPKRETITMLHMYNDHTPALDPFDTTAGTDPIKLKSWHVTLSRDARRFVIPQAEGVKKSDIDGTVQFDLKDALESAAEQWKPGPDDKIQEVYTDHPVAGKVWNMPLLIRGDMRAPTIYFAGIVKACEDARIWRISVSISPPPDVIAKPGGGS